MKFNIVNFENKSVGSLDVSEDIFGVKIRKDILARVVEWQLAKRRAGTHKAKQIGDVSGRKGKPFAQKGGGRARQGSLRSPQFRGGAVIFGPVVRSHAYDLPKKIRKLGLRVALSSKAKEGKLIVVDSFDIKSTKTKDFIAGLHKIGATSTTLMVGGEAIGENMVKASGNVAGVDVLPAIGANVYDIVRKDTLILTKEAVEKLEARLK